jgi:AraC family transcriptional regulator
MGQSAFDAYLRCNAGAGADYAIADANGHPIAAKWRRPAAKSKIRKLGQNVLMYQISGSTSVSMFIKGKCHGTGARHGSVTFRPHDLELESVRNGVCEMLHLYLDQDLINLYVQHNLEGTITANIDPVFAIMDPWLQGYFAMLVSEFEIFGGIDGQAHSLLLAQSQQLLVRHLVHWHSNVMRRSQRTVDNLGSPHPLSPRLLRLAIEYIEANIASEISLGDLAALTGLSTSHFIRCFRAATQRTPYGYLVEQRLLRVSEALQRGDLSLTEIALSAGFRNLSTLTNTFKRHYGVTPSAYRSRIG